MKISNLIKTSSLKNVFRGIMPILIRRLVRGIYYFPIDIFDLILGRRDKLVPPKRKSSVIGSTDFKKSGALHLRYLIEYGGLKASDTVLDVGCGYGRMAVALISFLNMQGKYEGIDILPDAIKWCKKHISLKYSHFSFILADIYNKSYNPKGKYKASEYKFPYDDESFDFLFLISVFTHIIPEDIENYLFELSRVLKRSGRCFISFFLLNNESHVLIREKKSCYDFKYFYEYCCLVDKYVPEYAIAYEETYIRKLYEKYALVIKEPIYYGGWAGRKYSIMSQDIIIAYKK